MTNLGFELGMQVQGLTLAEQARQRADAAVMAGQLVCGEGQIVVEAIDQGSFLVVPR